VNLANIDLVRTNCPPGTEIEIEGLGTLKVDFPCLNGLLSGIAAVYAIMTRRLVFENEDFLRWITLLKFDAKKKFVKVRITEVA